jgi:predicted DNA-binding transcriptional regulator AlpA
MDLKDKLLTTNEVLGILGIKRSWLAELRKKGGHYEEPDFPEPQPFGNQNRYLASEIYEWFERKLARDRAKRDTSAGLGKRVGKPSSESGHPSRTPGLSPQKAPKGAGRQARGPSPASSSEQGEALKIEQSGAPKVVIDVARRKIYIQTASGEEIPAIRRTLREVSRRGTNRGTTK